MAVNQIRAYRNKLDRFLADFRHAKKSVSEERESLEEVRDRLETINQAQSLVQSAAEQIQNTAHQQLASVVTRCLQTIFGDEYSFRIHFEKKRGRTEAGLVFVKDGMEVDPLLASGGGVVDVASLALRLSCLTLMQPRKRKVVILDEPLKAVSPNFHPIIRKMIESLSQDLGYQFIIVTQIPTLRVGKITEIGG